MKPGRCAAFGAILALVPFASLADTVHKSTSNPILSAKDRHGAAELLTDAASRGGAEVTRLAAYMDPRDTGTRAGLRPNSASNSGEGRGLLGLFGRNRADPRAVPSLAQLDRLPAAKGDSQWRCLAEAIYFEARGEPLEGQFAVAEVILNRVDSARFPSSICSVVRQGSSRPNACQFSFTCDGKPEVVHEREAFARAGKIARLMIDGRDRALTSGAKYFHATYVRPSWSRVFTRTATIGRHHFYSQTASR